MFFPPSTKTNGEIARQKLTVQSSYPKAYFYRRIVQAKLFMDQNFVLPIDLRNVCGEACFSKFHFLRAFKTTYGLTPHQYLIKVRIDKAEALLQEGLAVTDVCYAVGFESPGSFSALFKRRFGLTPSAFLKMQQIRKAAIEAAPLRFIPGCYAEKKGWQRKSNFEEAQPQVLRQL